MNFIKHLFFSKALQKTSHTALRIMRDTESMYGDEKHRINRQIIRQFSDSNNPLDILAVAIAYSGEGAKYRLESIHFFERFLAHPAEIPCLPNTFDFHGNPAPYFSYRTIYTILGGFYLSELFFDKAIECYRHVIELDGPEEIVGYTLIGNVYAKIDINQCVRYYEELKRTPSIWSKDESFLEKKIPRCPCPAAKRLYL